MKNIFLTLLSIFILSSCSNNSEDLNNVNNKLINANLDLKTKLSSYKNLLNQNNTSFVSEESLISLNSALKLDFKAESSLYSKKTSVELNDIQKKHINYLSFLLSNSESPEAALKILKDDFESISNSVKLSDDDKTFLLIVNSSIRMSTEFVMNEFNKSNSKLNPNFAKIQKSWWGCLKTAYADLTDDFVGTVALGLFPGPGCAAIVIGGTINYYRQ
jgi:hypothetical protein